MTNDLSKKFAVNYEHIKYVNYAAILDRCVAHPLENLITAFPPVSN